MRRCTSLSVEQALTRLRYLCNRGEYSSGEIKKKLVGWGVNISDSNRVLNILQRERLVDDVRFAEVFVHTKVVNSRWGRVKIKLHLLKKGISSAIIAAALNSIDEDEYENAIRVVINRKHRELGEAGDTYNGRTKIYRYAASRGFEPSIVARLLREK